MRYQVSLKHVDSNIMGGTLAQKWIDHAYSTLDGLFAVRASPAWNVVTTPRDDYVSLDIQGEGSRNDALEMVSKIIEEQNRLIKGLSLVLHEPNIE